MMNKNLITLAGSLMNPYNDKEALFYIYNINPKSEPIDETGNPIPSFKNNKELKEFKHYIEKNIVPVVKQGLKDTGFKYHGLELLNNEPHPSSIIMKSDNTDITPAEFTQLKKQMEEIVNKHNEKIFQAQKLFQTQSLFFKPKKSSIHDSKIICKNTELNHKFVPR